MGSEVQGTAGGNWGVGEGEFEGLVFGNEFSIVSKNLQIKHCVFQGM